MSVQSTVDALSSEFSSKGFRNAVAFGRTRAVDEAVTGFSYTHSPESNTLTVSYTTEVFDKNGRTGRFNTNNLVFGYSEIDEILSRHGLEWNTNPFFFFEQDYIRQLYKTNKECLTEILTSLRTLPNNTSKSGLHFYDEWLSKGVVTA